jgi:cyclase
VATAWPELAGTSRGGPIDVMGALADMVAYNGGKPLTCLA